MRDMTIRNHTAALIAGAIRISTQSVCYQRKNNALFNSAGKLLRKQDIMKHCFNYIKIWWITDIEAHFKFSNICHPKMRQNAGFCVCNFKNFPGVIPLIPLAGGRKQEPPSAPPSARPIRPCAGALCAPGSAVTINTPLGLPCKLCWPTIGPTTLQMLEPRHWYVGLYIRGYGRDRVG